MPRSPLAAAVASSVLAATATSPAVASGGMSRPGGVISTGGSGLDLLGRRGPPSLLESRPAQLGDRAGDGVQGASRTVIVTLQTWTCVLGSRAQVRLVHVRDGLVTGARTGGRGYSE